MQINPTFAFDAGATQTDINEFEGAVDTVINLYDSLFSNNVTLNVAFGYGESFNGTSNNNTQINWTPMANAGPGGFALGKSNEPVNSFAYSTIRTDLVNNFHNGSQSAAYATLPTTSPFGNDTLWMGVGEQKALGFNPSANYDGEDGVVGIISNEELAAGGDSADWTQTTPANNSQFYMVGSIEHELSEVMGRQSFDGTNAVNNAPSYTLMDMFRYSQPGVRQTTNGNPSYFSINNGNNVFYYWNNPALASGDLGDWAASGPNGFDSTGHDAFLNNSSPGVVNEVSSFDKTLMNVLGWNLSPPPPPPSVTSAFLGETADGSVDYLGFSGTSLFTSNLVSYTSWKTVAEGDFDNDGDADLVTQDPASGAINMLSVDNGALTGSSLKQGTYWNVVGAGDFDGSGRTGIATQSSATGQIDLLWFNGTQLSGSELLNGSYQHVVGAADINSDGKDDLVTQDPSGGQLDFLFFNGANLVGSSQTPDSFWAVHDAYNTSPGQTTMVTQDAGSGQVDYLNFGGTAFSSSNLLQGNYSGLTPVQGTEVAKQFYGI